MNIAVAFALIQAGGAIEPLPIEERLAAYEAALPELRQAQARIEAYIGRLGQPERDWATAGMSAESAVTAGRGSVAEHVLGEWEVGGHGLAIPADQSLPVPEEMRRYSVRDYSGPVSYHTYHRAAPGIVFHSFGTVRRIGNAECQTTTGIEIISRERWQDWPADIALRVFSTARMTREDSRTYCVIYRPTHGNRFTQLAYTQEGQPYLAVNEDAQNFVVTPRAEALSRIFE